MSLPLDVTAYARRKAVIATAVFALWGLIWALSTENWGTAIFPVAAYAILVFNTFFSVRAFSQITPRDSVSQNIIDIVIAGLYLAICTQFENNINFVFLGTILFSFTVIKYALLVRALNKHISILRRKIFANSLGMIFCGISAALAVGGYATAAALLYTCAFVATTVYFFLVNPLYVIPSEHSSNL